MQHAANLFAEQVNPDATVIPRHEDAAAHRGGHDERGVGSQPIGFGERTFDDDPEVGSSIFNAFDPHERL